MSAATTTGFFTLGAGLGTAALIQTFAFFTQRLTIKEERDKRTRPDRIRIYEQMVATLSNVNSQTHEIEQQLRHISDIDTRDQMKRARHVQYEELRRLLPMWKIHITEDADSEAFLVVGAYDDWVVDLETLDSPEDWTQSKHGLRMDSFLKNLVEIVREDLTR